MTQQHRRQVDMGDVHKNKGSKPFLVSRTVTKMVETTNEFGEIIGIKQETINIPVAHLWPANATDGLCDQIEYIILERIKGGSPMGFDMLVMNLIKKGHRLVEFMHSSVVLSNKLGPHSFAIIDDQKTPWLNMNLAEFTATKEP